MFIQAELDRFASGFQFTISSNIIDPVASYSEPLSLHARVTLFGTPATAVQAQVQINALAYKNLFDLNGNPVLSTSLADGDIIDFYYSAASDSFIVYSPQPMSDAVLREQALSGDYLVEVSWGGNYTQSLDTAGDRLAVIAGALEPFPDFPASRVIKGTRFPKDYATDTDNNYWKATDLAPFGTPAWVVIDLGQVRTFNSVVVYQHPTEPLQSNGEYIPSVNAYNFYGVNTLPGGFPSPPNAAGGWNLIASITMIGGETFQPEPGEDALTGKTEARFKDSVSYRYLAFRTSGGGLDALARICSIEAYNWIDESARVVWRANQGPDVQIERVLDQSQTSIPTPSECRVNFTNEDGRYTPGNSSSPLYGVQQVDGRGEGVRSGIPVRVTALVTGSDGKLRSKRIFDGFVANDQSVGGPMAISTDELSRTALLVCKGISTTLTNEVDSPVYEGDFFSTMLKDLVARGGVAFQDLLMRSISQAVPFVSFARQSVLASLTAIGRALPFFRVFERHDPAAIEVKNHGRSRADFDYTRFPGTTDSLGNLGTDLVTFRQIAADLKTTSCQRMVHNGDDHYFWMASILTFRATDGGRVDYGTVLGSPKLYRWNEKASVADSSLASSAYNRGAVFHLASQWASVYNGNLFEITGEWYGLTYTQPKMRRAALTSSGTLSFTDLGDIGKSGSGFESLVSATRSGQFVFYLMVRLDNIALTGPNSMRLYVWDTTQAFSTRVDKGTDAGTNIDVRHVMSDGTFFAYTKATQSTALQIWKHAGTPYSTALSFVTRNFFSFGTIGLDGADYAGTTVPRVRYFLSTDGYLYAAAQPKKVNGLYRYEIWRVLMADLWAGTATATLMGVLEDDVSNDISDLLVNGTYVYVLDRFNFWVWDTAKDITRKFSLGTAFQHVPFKRADAGFFDPDNGNNPSRVPPPFHNQVLSRSRPYFLHQGTFEVQSNRYKIGATSYGWSSRHTDVGSDMPAIDSEGRVWVTLGEDSGGINLSRQLHAFSISNDQFELDPSLSFDIRDGFVATMKIMDGNPDANSIKMSVNPLRLDPNVSAVWTQQADDPITFPAGVATTGEIPLNSISNRGFNFNTSNRRYITIFGKTVFDNPLTPTSVTIEGVARNVTFWALGQKAFLTVDNTNKPACQLSGIVVYGKAIAPRFSNSTIVTAEDAGSIRLYKRKYDLEISNEFANDPTFANDILLAGKYAGLWVEEVKLPWYPNLEPGDEVLLTYPEDGIVNKPFEVTGVKHNGFRTSLSAREVHPFFVI